MIRHIDDSWLKRKFRYKHGWEFEGRHTTGLANLGEGDVGVQKCLRKKIAKSEFIDNFVEDISGIYRFTEAHGVVLKVLLNGNEFRASFKINAEFYTLLASRCGYAPTTIERIVVSLRASKKIFQKVKGITYKLDKGLVYIMEEVRKMDFVQVLLTYEFVNKGAEKEKEAGEFPEITLDFINKVSEVYRLQQERKEKIKSLNESDTTQAL